MVDVVCAEDSTIIFTTSGLIYVCGEDRVFLNQSYIYPTVHQSFNEKSVASICMKFNQTAFLTTSGEIYTWGTRTKTGDPFSLGHGDSSDQQLPKRVEALSGIVCKQVDAGGDHFAVLTEGGKVFTFGSGTYGQLGHGNEEQKYLPTLVQALENRDIKELRCGEHFTMVLSRSGYVYTCGMFDRATREKVWIPRLLKELREHNVAQISCRDDGQCAVLVDPNSNSNTFRQAQQLHFNIKEHSDVIFMVENAPIYASIEVLSRKSEYFNAMFRSNMKESIERVVPIPDISRVVFLKLLEYLCRDDFSLSSLQPLLVLDLLYLGDMYLLDGLVLICLDQLKRFVIADKNNAFEILHQSWCSKGVDATNHWCNEVQRICIKSISDESNADPPTAELVQNILFKDKLYFIKLTLEDVLDQQWFLVQVDLDATKSVNPDYMTNGKYYCVFMYKHHHDRRKSDEKSRWWPEWFEYKKCERTGEIEYGKQILFRPNEVPDGDRYIQGAMMIDLVSTNTTGKPVGDGPSRLLGPFDFVLSSKTVSTNRWKALHVECVCKGIKPPSLESVESRMRKRRRVLENRGEKR